MGRSGRTERLLRHITKASGDVAAHSAEEFADGLPPEERESFWRVFGRLGCRPALRGGARSVSGDAASTLISSDTGPTVVATYSARRSKDLDRDEVERVQV